MRKLLSIRNLMQVFALLFMSGLAANVSAASLTGLWVGYYAYQNGDRVPVSIVFEQLGNDVIGTMIEPQTFGESLDIGKQAIVAGVIGDEVLEFEKAYASDIANWKTFELKPGSSYINYRLVLSSDGHEMSGTWAIGDLSGRASLKRVTPGVVDRLPRP